jgi:hypothetical protein
LKHKAKKVNKMKLEVGDHTVMIVVEDHLTVVTVVDVQAVEAVHPVENVVDLQAGTEVDLKDVLKVREIYKSGDNLIGCPSDF